MAAALIGVCVDPRLNHEIIRLQVRQRLERSGLRAERIYIGQLLWTDEPEYRYVPFSFGVGS